MRLAGCCALTSYTHVPAKVSETATNCLCALYRNLLPVIAQGPRNAQVNNLIIDTVRTLDLHSHRVDILCQTCSFLQASLSCIKLVQWPRVKIVQLVSVRIKSYIWAGRRWGSAPRESMLCDVHHSSDYCALPCFQATYSSPHPPI
jgi:hypothetical protein